MELEEMKTQWIKMSEEIEKQKKLTASLINKMTETGYRNKMNKILLPETAGALVCMAAVAFIIANFQKLDTHSLWACGIISVSVCCLLSLFSLNAAYKLWSVDIANSNYKQMLAVYSKARKQFVFVQKMSFYLGALLFVAMLPVMGRLMSGADPFKVSSLWILYAVGFIFFSVCTKWVFKKYNKTTADAENILKELDAE
jgi:hypothetical protein